MYPVENLHASPRVPVPEFVLPIAGLMSKGREGNGVMGFPQVLKIYL